MPFGNRYHVTGVPRFSDADTQQLHRVTDWSPMLPPDPVPNYPAGRRQRPKLHWMQWVVYIVVITTCAGLIYTMIELWLFLDMLQDTLRSLGDTFNSNLIGE